MPPSQPNPRKANSYARAIDPEDRNKTNTLEAIKALQARNIRFLRPTKYQLKVGDLSYYPGKGTIFRDGDVEALKERGIESFLELVSMPRRRF